MARNDPKVIAKLLRAIANGTDAKRSKHDVIFTAAANMLDPGEVCAVMNKGEPATE